PPHLSLSGFVVMGFTVAVNIAVIRYETREANRLDSEVLLADALQTRGDLWTSFTVIAALFAARLGLPILDPVAALIVVGFISHSGFEIAQKSMRILSDRIVIAEADLQRIVMSVPGILGCHQIRTRGTADQVFLDLHIWL